MHNQEVEATEEAEAQEETPQKTEMMSMMKGSYICRCSTKGLPKARRGRKKRRHKHRKHKAKVSRRCKHPRKYKQCVRNRLSAGGTKVESRKACRKRWCQKKKPIYAGMYSY